MDKEYIIYHIPGKKIGVTNDLYNRVEQQQGYDVGEYEILESSNDIDYISRREIELQKEYGYRVDLKPYNELSVNLKLKNMKINVTEQTTTFPCPLNKLKGQLMDNLEMRWDTEHGSVYLDADLAKWIVKSAKTSMFNNDRCYVYNKAMIKYLDYKRYKNEIDELPFKEEDFYKDEDCDDCGEVVFYFDKIRDWAEEKGIYKSGDPKTQYIKLMEEAGEVGRAILKQDLPEIKDGIGDMVVVLTNLAELCDLSIEECVESAYDVISKRTGKMKNGTFVKDN
jgi:NTP pyrophosphatase (non-canonical NTP hydrolase)